MSSSGAKESLTDMTSLLFQQLERLGNSDLSGDELQEEVRRSKAMADISTRIIQSGELVLRAHVLHSDRLDAGTKLPKLLESNE